MIDIQDKLTTALAAEVEATNAHALAALAVEQGTGTAADLTKASKTLEGAQKRVQDLKAATKAAAQAEAARVAAERAAAAAKAQQELKDAIAKVRQQGLRIDALLDALADVGRDFNDAVTAAYMKHPDAGTVMQIDRARTYAQDVIVYRLREFFGNEGGSLALSPERTRLERFVNHLPE